MMMRAGFLMVKRDVTKREGVLAQADGNGRAGYERREPMSNVGG